MMKPGKVERVKVKIEKWMKVNGLFPDTYVKRSMVLLKRTKKQAGKMRKKRSVRKPLRGPSSLRTLQGPILRALAMPQLAEKREVRLEASLARCFTFSETSPKTSRGDVFFKTSLEHRTVKQKVRCFYTMF